MKATANFKQVISAHLEGLAQKDPLFAKTLAKENKNIDDCITYILNTVKASGNVGFADDEVFGMAIHYYDEDNIDVGKPISAKVVVNHAVELSAEEIQKAKDKAMDDAIAEQKRKLTKRPASKKEGPTDVVQQSLF